MVDQKLIVCCCLLLCVICCLLFVVVRNLLFVVCRCLWFVGFVCLFVCLLVIVCLFVFLLRFCFVCLFCFLCFFVCLFVCPLFVCLFVCCCCCCDGGAGGAFVLFVSGMSAGDEVDQVQDDGYAAPSPSFFTKPRVPHYPVDEGVRQILGTTGSGEARLSNEEIVV